jgi:hypothetical protein
VLRQRLVRPRAGPDPDPFGHEPRIVRGPRSGPSRCVLSSGGLVLWFG